MTAPQRVGASGPIEALDTLSGFEPLDDTAARPAGDLAGTTFATPPARQRGRRPLRSDPERPRLFRWRAETDRPPRSGGEHGGDHLVGPDSALPRRPGHARLVRHSLFGVLLCVGIVLRCVTVLGYRPAFEFNGDSYAYLRLTPLSEPDPMRPAGYPAFLRALTETGADLWIVPAVQHVLGIVLATALYALLLRRRVAAPIAALAAAPLLLDAYQIVIEHFVMAETLFALLLVGAILALMWSPRPSVWAMALAGLLLGTSGLVRTIGVAVGLLAFGYLLLRRVGWLRVGIFAVFLAAPLIGYASWFQSAHGKFGLTGGDAAWLYGRVAPIADCDQLDLDPEQRSLCSPHPAAERPDPSFYVWDRNSPSNRLGVPVEERDALLNDFSRQVILRQPGDYLRMVGSEIAHYFRPGRPVGPRDWPDATWRFPTGDEPRYLHNNEPLLGLHGEDDRPDRKIVEPWAGLLRDYQTRGFTPGPALAVAGGLGLLACLGVGLRAAPAGLRGEGRTRGRDLTAERRRIGADCLFLVATGMAMLVVPAATVCFDYRYMLPVLFLLPPAAALATRQARLLLLARRERRDGQVWSSPSAAGPDPLDGAPAAWPSGADRLDAGDGPGGDRAADGGWDADAGQTADGRWAAGGGWAAGADRAADAPVPIGPTVPLGAAGADTPAGSDDRGGSGAPVDPAAPVSLVAPDWNDAHSSHVWDDDDVTQPPTPVESPPLPKRTPGGTLESRRRPKSGARRPPARDTTTRDRPPPGTTTDRPERDAKATERPTRRPVDRGPDARMPTPGARPDAPGPAPSADLDGPPRTPAATDPEPDPGDGPTNPG